MELQRLKDILVTDYVYEWFIANHLDSVSKEFLGWWVIFYGLPSSYDSEESEQDDYFIRMAFACQGWNAATNDSDGIKSFTGFYRFLSNFYAAEASFEGEVYPTAEHAFQASKTEDEGKRVYFRKHIKTSGHARRAGLQLRLRLDWEDVKVGIMEQIVRDKFSRVPLRILLLATGDRELVEGNSRGDQFWGVCDKKGWGRNMLGKILMRVREELRSES